MKFQESGLNGSKATVGIKITRDGRTDVPKAICPSTFFQSLGHINHNQTQ